jgi:hypothetical protein
MLRGRCLAVVAMVSIRELRVLLAVEATQVLYHALTQR